MSDKKITEKQKEILKFVIGHKLSHNGNSPSVEEICAACDLAVATVFYHLDKLVEAEEIERPGGGVRNIEVPKYVEWRLRKE